MRFNRRRRNITCSCVSLRLFRPALHRLSYQPNKKARRLGDTGLWQKSRYFDGRVSQTPVAHGERIRRLTGDMPRAFLFANVTRPQGHHFWLLLLWGDRIAAGATVRLYCYDEAACPKVRKNSRAASK